MNEYKGPTRGDDIERMVKKPAKAMLDFSELQPRDPKRSSSETVGVADRAREALRISKELGGLLCPGSAEHSSAGALMAILNRCEEGRLCEWPAGSKAGPAPALVHLRTKEVTVDEVSGEKAIEAELWMRAVPYDGLKQGNDNVGFGLGEPRVANWQCLVMQVRRCGDELRLLPHALTEHTDEEFATETAPDTTREG